MLISIFYFSETLYKLCYDILLDKLSKLDITRNKGWIKKFLTNRIMSIIADHQKNDSYDVHSGAPAAFSTFSLMIFIHL